MATVNKNFRIKQGLIVEGTTGTINNQNILTETGGDEYILNLVGGATLVKSVDSGTFTVDGSGNLTINSGVFDPSGAADTAESNAKSYADGLASNYDPAGAAGTAESNAKSYADGLASNYDPAGAAGTAESNAKSYADGLASNYDPAGSASTAESNANSYTDTAVANLVDGAPALLDTLNELAAAINDDPSFAGTIATTIGGKVAKSGDTMTGALTLSGAPTSNLHAATKLYVDTTAGTAESNAKSYADGLASNYDPAGAAGTAESNAKSYADGLASNYDPAGAASTAESNANGYTDGYVGAVLDGTEAFTAINLNSVSMQKAVQANLASISANSSVMSWAKADYPTAKLWVKFATSTHSQISEVLLTTDSSNNIAITEFAEVGTNGSLGTVTAGYNAGNIGIAVDTVYANTEVTVVATLIK